MGSGWTEVTAETQAEVCEAGDSHPEEERVGWEGHRAWLGVVVRVTWPSFLSWSACEFLLPSSLKVSLPPWRSSQYILTGFFFFFFPSRFMVFQFILPFVVCFLKAEI